MSCLDRNLFEANFTIDGRDILDTDPKLNPFYDHNHVLIPYCSSDLWLASEVTAQQECDCGDLNCFNYSADSQELQFAFRGKIIFQSIFEQLLTDHGMGEAKKILLGGSSAGGVGVTNLAQWVHDRVHDNDTSPDPELFLLLDSAWFINFQDGVSRVFNGATNTNQISTMRLFDIIATHPPCANMSLGYPCCISAHCVMTTREESGALAYFPETGVQTFALSSVYDIFLLAPAVAGLDAFEAVMGGNAGATTGLLIDFLRVVGEYGGEMNFTLGLTFDIVSKGFFFRI